MIENIDCLDGLKTLEDNSIDCLVTDPPYGIKFMGKDWDKALPPKEVWSECLRVLKPGSFGFVCCTPRQDCLSHMIVNLEEAGFMVNFTSLYWTYATGFPKARNLYKATNDNGLKGAYAGYQPKPAVEPIIVVMKPLSEPNYTKQALATKKGCTWLDAARIPLAGIETHTTPGKCGMGKFLELGPGKLDEPSNEDSEILRYNVSGRYPANLVCQDDVLNDGTVTSAKRSKRGAQRTGNVYGEYGRCDTVRGHTDEGSYSRYFDLDAWFQDRIQKLPEAVQKTLPLFIVAKPGRKEKNQGLEGMPPKTKPLTGEFKDNPGRQTPKSSPTPRPNFHPTVKPIALMSYLITLGSVENDTVLDPYLGSGTTGIAASMLSRNFVGFELSKEYADIATMRIKNIA
jgi:site-specific DNA-methyltransferase (adenine-specific)